MARSAVLSVDVYIYPVFARTCQNESSDDVTDVPDDSDNKRKHRSRALLRCFSDILRHSSTTRVSANSPRPKITVDFWFLGAR